jgi:hypothetical protein
VFAPLGGTWGTKGRVFTLRGIEGVIAATVSFSLILMATYLLKSRVKFRHCIM